MRNLLSATTDTYRRTQAGHNKYVYVRGQYTLSDPRKRLVFEVHNSSDCSHHLRVHFLLLIRKMCEHCQGPVGCNKESFLAIAMEG